jgi:hypothetical protein
MGYLQPRNEQNASAPRLGFHEIVPGFDGGTPPDQDQEIQIPEFDLSRHLMVDERRESAARRQGPGKKQESAQVGEPIEPAEHFPDEVSEAVPARAAEMQVSAYRHPVIQRHAIVEDIVRRDIQRLCMAPQTV